MRLTQLDSVWSGAQRSYSRLYTREEHEAAVVIQSGYRGFRARQQLKERGIELGGSSSSRRRSSTGASYSRRVSSPRSSQSRRVAPSQSAYSPSVSSSTQERAASARSVLAPGQRSRPELQMLSAVSARGDGETARRESQSRRVSAAAERPADSSDGFRTVYERQPDGAGQPGPPEPQSSRRPSQTSAASVRRPSRRDSAQSSPTRSRSRSGVSSAGGRDTVRNSFCSPNLLKKN